MARMIFCNIAYMVFYRGRSDSDDARGGGSHPEKEEEHNFDPLGDYMYGYVPAVARTIDVARIGPVRGDVACVRKKDPNVLPCCDARTDGIDVVWTAASPEQGRVVVGWYRNATVFRHLQKCEHGVYQIKARTADCRLLPVERRTINIETGHTGRSGRPGHSPVWYAETQYGASLRRRVLRQMQEAERQIFDRDDLETKAAALKSGDRPPRGTKRPWREQRQIAVVARDPAVHAWILETAKGRCELCGSDAPFARPGGRPYLEIHHVDRLADGGADVPDNAVALCPNCHREVHYGDRADAIRQKLLDRVARRRQY